MDTFYLCIEIPRVGILLGKTGKDNVAYMRVNGVVLYSGPLCQDSLLPNLRG